MNIGARFVSMSSVLLAFLLIDFALFETMLPINFFVLFTDWVAVLPVPAIAATGTLCWILSGPAIAAAFAIYRDSPAMRSFEGESARGQWLARPSTTGAIAGNYWHDNEDARILRPFFRTYRALLRRSFVVSASFGGFSGALVVAALAAMSLGYSSVAVFLFASATYVVLAEFVALDLVVEFPRAHYLAIFRHSLFLLARRWQFSALELGLIVIFIYLVTQWPWLTFLAASGLVLFFLYHCVAMIVMPVRDLIIQEEVESHRHET